jgi:hypothetical protein
MKHVLLADLTTDVATSKVILSNVAIAYEKLKVNPNQLLLIKIAKDTPDLQAIVKTAKKRYKELDLHWESSRWYNKPTYAFTHYVLEITIL